MSPNFQSLYFEREPFVENHWILFYNIVYWNIWPPKYFFWLRYRLLIQILITMVWVFVFLYLELSHCLNDVGLTVRVEVVEIKSPWLIFVKNGSYYSFSRAPKFLRLYYWNWWVLLEYKYKIIRIKVCDLTLTKWRVFFLRFWWS